MFFVMYNENRKRSRGRNIKKGTKGTKPTKGT